MTFSHSIAILFAEDNGGGGGLFGPMMVPMIAIGILFWVIMVRGGRRDREKRQSALDALKKNDRVVTIGGIIGTISHTSQDGKEVTLKLEGDSKLKVLRSAIQGPLREDATPSADTAKEAATAGETS